jgi:spore maturation protein CgeB
MAKYDLSNYDGVLAFGEELRQIYLDCGWAQHAWTWHEAADIRVFRPRPLGERESDICWIGNWGDGERTAELQEFLVDPARELSLKGFVHGVRYPEQGRKMLEAAGLEYRGWLPNFRVPQAFARAALTVHIPRRPYVEALPGIPTIRPFEAMACGIPLIIARWRDAEGLFTPGSDFLVARNGREMARHLDAVLRDRDLARELSQHAVATIRERHTCAHRVDELLDVVAELQHGAERPARNVPERQEVIGETA